MAPPACASVVRQCAGNSAGAAEGSRARNACKDMAASPVTEVGGAVRQRRGGRQGSRGTTNAAEMEVSNAVRAARVFGGDAITQPVKERVRCCRAAQPQVRQRGALPAASSCFAYGAWYVGTQCRRQCWGQVALEGQ